MADTKISNLTTSTLASTDYVATSRAGSNYKLGLSGAIDSWLTGNVAQGNSPLNEGKIKLINGNGGFAAVQFTSQDDSVPGPYTSQNYYGFSFVNTDDATLFLKIPEGPNDEDTNLFLPLFNGTGYLAAMRDNGDRTITTAGYALNYYNFVYNSGNLTLSDAQNGKSIISTNTTGITYTVASGLTTGYSCLVVQYGTGAVEITGAAGISVNSYGGLTSLGGQYGSAAISWVNNNSYLLAGNLA